MAEIDILLISNTLDRVRESLNRRFEKDASLYISNQETQEIKNKIRKKQYQGIYGMYQTKKNSAEILTKIILRNAWLITDISNYEIDRYLIPIFKECKQVFFIEIMKDVIDNKIDVPYEIKKMLIPLYYNDISVIECESIIEDDQDIRHNNNEILVICFKRIVSSLILPNEIYRKIKYYFKKFPKLEEKIFLLEFDYVSDSNKKDLARIIFENEIILTEEPKRIWINALCRFKKDAFNILESHLLTCCDDRDPNIKKLSNYFISKLINDDKENQDYYMNSILKMYSCNPNVRYWLIRNGCGKIKNIELQKELLRRFRILGLPRGTEEIAADIEEGNDRHTKILTATDIYENITRNSNIKNIHYIIFMVNKFNQGVEKNSLFTDFLSSYGSEDIGRNFVIEFLNIDRNIKFIDLTIEYLDRNRSINFIDEVLKIIDIKQANSNAIKDFVYKNDFKLYKKLFGRY